MIAVNDALDTDRVHGVAVFLPGWVGDTVMATPALRALRRRFAQATFVLFGKPAPLAVLEGSGLSDAALADPSAGPWWRGFAVASAAGRLRHARCDVAVLLPNSFRTALIAAWAGIARRIGYDRDGRGWLLTDRLMPSREGRRFRVVPALDYYLDLAAAIGADVADRRMGLGVTADGEDLLRTMLDEADCDPDRPLVVLNPGGAFGPSKRWPAERYAKVADALVREVGAQIIINAAPTERAVAAQTAAAMQAAPLVNMADRRGSLAMLKSLLKRAALLITNDTGARHIGAAMGAGVVTIFGSTGPDWTTIDYDRERIVRADVPCAPCQKKRCPNPSGPTFHQCMQAVQPETVLAAAMELLAETPDRTQPVEATDVDRRSL